MKKIFNRVLAAAMAVPMVLTQGVVGTVSAEDTGAKALKADTFTYIAPDQTESNWNEKLLNVVIGLEGTQQEISKDDFLALIPQTNSYGVMLAEVMAGAANPVLTVNNGIVTIKGAVDLSTYAEAKIYSKVRNAAGMDLTMTAFNKTVEYSATVDGNALMDGKTFNVVPVITIDGQNIDQSNASDYFKDLAAQLAAEVSAQISVTADIADAMNIEFISKMEKAESWAAKAAKLERTGEYATADETLAAVSTFFDKRTDAYEFPSSVDEAVARHGKAFDKAVDLLSGITVTSGFILDITADDIAAIVKEGSDFEVTVSGGVYNMTFTIPDDEADAVAEYVNANATPDENGVTMVYASSKKIVEVQASVTGEVFYNVTREIKYVNSALTTTTTDVTTTTTSTDVTTTTTTTTSTDDTTTTTTETTLPAEFEVESVEIEAGVGYYFSHDENEFDLSGLISKLTLVGTLDGEAYSVVIAASNYATYLTPAYATPAEFFNAVEGTAYVANELALTVTMPKKQKVANDADLSVTGPTVYIGVKGDADLNGVVAIADAQKVLSYYAQAAAQVEMDPLNEDANLVTLAYFLADVDTESTAGADSADGVLQIADAQAILAYYSQNAAELNPTWDEILGK